MSNKYVTKLNYLSYCTIFSASGSRNCDLHEYPCFADVLNRCRITSEHYELYLYTDIKPAKEEAAANMCFLNIRELKKHIGLARRLFPFKYSVEPSKYGDKECFKITLDVNLPHFCHRYLLTWIRYAYEFPFNLILNDALRLKHTCLKKENIPNLFVLCANSFCSGPMNYNSGHAIGYGRYNKNLFLKETELKAIIQKLSQSTSIYSNVNSIYPTIIDRGYPELPNTENNKYLEYWTDPEDFDKRVKIYIEGYNRIKSLKK